MCLPESLLPKLLGTADKNSFGAPDVAKSIRVFVLNHFADELRAAFAEPCEGIVYVRHGEHDARVTQRVHRCAAVIGNICRRSAISPVTSLLRATRYSALSPGMVRW